MKPRKTIAARGRWAAVAVAAAGIVAIGTLVPNRVVTAPEEEQVTKVVAADRPSYLSELPELTEQALQAGAIEPSVVPASTGDALSVRATTVAELTISPSVETDTSPSAETEVAEAAPEPEPQFDLFQVTADGLNVRSGPSSNSGKLFVLKQDEAVQVAEIEGSWARIMTASGDSGWAYERYLAPAE